ncbi:hypothetical protein CR513_06781, partial [Mucuna pruriens]
MEKVKAIQDWLTQKIISEVRSFHGLASFYRSVGFKWEQSQERALKSLKDMLTHAFILAFSNFTKSFEFECDASNVGHLIAYFSENLKGVHLNYSTYDKKFYSLVMALYVEFLEQFPYFIKHKQSKMNIIYDALFRIYALISILETKLLGFESLNELYENDIDLGEAFAMCANLANGDYFRHDNFLFKEKKLCMPRSFIRELLVKETHKGGSWVT